MMRSILAMVAAIAAGPSALAADLSIPSPITVVDVFSGVYFGADFGRGWADGNGLWTPGGNPGGFIDFKPSPKGTMAGGFAGYGHMLGSWYLGIEGDWNWSGQQGAVDIPSPDFSALQRNRWLASARARAGYITPWNALIYLTAGYGWAGETFTLGAPGFSTAILSQDRTVSGWVAGGGLEVPIYGRLAGRVEYLHYHLGDLTTSDPGLTAPPLNMISIHDQVDVVRGGILYRF